MDGDVSRTAATAAVNATFLPLRPCLSSALLLLGVDDCNLVWWKLIALAIVILVTDTFTMFIGYDIHSVDSSNSSKIV